MGQKRLWTGVGAVRLACLYGIHREVYFFGFDFFMYFCTLEKGGAKAAV